MMRTRTTLFAAALVALSATTLQAQSTPVGTTPEASRPRDGHYHEGELGEKLLILESALKCDCGCGLDVHSCQFQMQCGTSPVWSRQIREALEAGETVEAIQAGFVAEYGLTVLMAPPPEGFNLVGYLLPAIAIVTAGMFVGMLTRRGRTEEALAPVDALSDDEAGRLAAAMKQLDELESPDW